MVSKQTSRWSVEETDSDDDDLGNSENEHGILTDAEAKNRRRSHEQGKETLNKLKTESDDTAIVLTGWFAS